MESHSGMVLIRITEEFGEKSVPVPLRPPHNPPGLTPASAVRYLCVYNIRIFYLLLPIFNPFHCKILPDRNAGVKAPLWKKFEKHLLVPQCPFICPHATEA
jgi:hypothetical protein